MFSEIQLASTGTNVYDSESGIGLVEVMVGSSPGGSDIMTAAHLHGQGHGSTTLTLQQPLDEEATVYVTLRAKNNAGN